MRHPETPIWSTQILQDVISPSTFDTFNASYDSENFEPNRKMLSVGILGSTLWLAACGQALQTSIKPWPIPAVEPKATIITGPSATPRKDAFTPLPTLEPQQPRATQPPLVTITPIISEAQIVPTSESSQPTTQEGPQPVRAFTPGRIEGHCPDGTTYNVPFRFTVEVFPQVTIQVGDKSIVVEDITQPVDINVPGCKAGTLQFGSVNGIDNYYYTPATEMVPSR